MLNKLRIKNVVLIENAELDFSRGLNVLSGETGAGKSILIDAVMLLLGGRYDKNLLRHGAESGLVEGLFLLDEKSRKQFEESGFDAEDEAVVARRFFADGRSEIRINGHPATSAMLKTITSGLIDIYGQNDSRYYADRGVQLNVLDYYVRNDTKDLSEKLLEEYRNYKKILIELNDLGDETQREKTVDFLKYQLNEIEAAKVKRDEEEDLTERRRIALSAEKIAELINQGLSSLKSDGSNTAHQSLKKLEVYDAVFAELAQRLQSVLIETEDIYDTLRTQREKFRFDTGELDRIEERLMIVRSIKRKYGDYDKITAFVKDAKERIDKLESGAELFGRLTAAKTNSINRLYGLSQRISQIRRAGALALCKKIEEELSQLGMERARFEIRFDEFPTREACEKFLSQNGMDFVEFYLSANAGQPLKPFSKIVSGGEMSRFMLTLKVITGDADAIPTMIFDEIDAGISGKVGQEVAKKLARIALHRQILCVTHLPQIAAMADSHFYISKDSNENNTFTEITALDRDGMILELSRLCGSIGITDKSESNAAGMKKWSDDYKESIKKAY